MIPCNIIHSESIFTGSKYKIWKIKSFLFSLDWVTLVSFDLLLWCRGCASSVLHYRHVNRPKPQERFPLRHALFYYLRRRLCSSDLPLLLQLISVVTSSNRLYLQGQTWPAYCTSLPPAFYCHLFPSLRLIVSLDGWLIRLAKHDLCILTVVWLMATPVSKGWKEMKRKRTESRRVFNLPPVTIFPYQNLPSIFEVLVVDRAGLGRGSRYKLREHILVSYWP